MPRREALGNLLAGKDRPEEAAGFLDRAFYLRLALGDDKGASRVLAGLRKLAEGHGQPQNLAGYKAALKTPSPYRLDQRCP